MLIYIFNRIEAGYSGRTGSIIQTEVILQFAQNSQKVWAFFQPGRGESERTNRSESFLIIVFHFIHPYLYNKGKPRRAPLGNLLLSTPSQTKWQCYWDCGATRLRSRTSVEAVKCREMISLERETCKSFKFKILDLTLLGQRPKQHFKFEWTTESWFT